MLWVNISESHEYVMKIVPTTYEDLGGTKIVAYQYTYAYRSYVAFGHGGKVIPAIWFRSDFRSFKICSTLQKSGYVLDFVEDF